MNKAQLETAADQAQTDKRQQLACATLAA